MNGRDFSSDSRQRLVEYTLICGVVGLVVVVCVRAIDAQLASLFAQISIDLMNAIA